MSLLEADSEWLSADTPFSDWMVKMYFVCGRSPQTTTRRWVRPFCAGR